MSEALDDLKKELPHVIVLALLLIVLLVIVTKFKVVHCSQVPQWCGVYCQIMGKSKVAMVSGDNGIGNPEELASLIQKLRYYTVVEPFPASEMSYGLLKDYELVILERFKNVTLGQANALKAYLNGGGSVLWIGDAASRLYLSEEDKAEARLVNDTWASQNRTAQGLYYYEYLEKTVGETKGFGDLANYVLATYVENKASQEPIVLRMIAKDHLVAKGIKTEFSNPAGEFSVVNERPAGVTKIAVLRTGGKEYPAIFEASYVGKVLYIALPLEKIDSNALVTNIMDYLVTC